MALNYVLWVNQSSKDIPEGSNFVEVRSMLAKEGGRLLVNVLRDMIDGTVRFLHKDSD